MRAALDLSLRMCVMAERCCVTDDSGLGNRGELSAEADDNAALVEGRNCRIAELPLAETPTRAGSEVVNEAECSAS